MSSLHLKQEARTTVTYVACCCCKMQGLLLTRSACIGAQAVVIQELPQASSMDVSKATEDAQLSQPQCEPTSRHQRTAAALLLKASMRSESICWLSYPSCLCSSRRLQSKYCMRAVWAAAGSAACKCAA